MMVHSGIEHPNVVHLKGFSFYPRAMILDFLPLGDLRGMMTRFTSDDDVDDKLP